MAQNPNTNSQSQQSRKNPGQFDKTLTTKNARPQTSKSYRDDDDAEESGDESTGSSRASSAKDYATDFLASFAPDVANGFLKNLAGGDDIQEKIAEWTEMLKTNRPDGIEGVGFDMIGALIPEITADVDFDNLTDWETVKKAIVNNSSAAVRAAAVAGAVGLSMIAKEYIEKRASGFSLTGKIAKKGKSVSKKVVKASASKAKKSAKR